MVAVDGVPLSLVAAELLFEQSEVRTTTAFGKLNAGSAETSLINSLRISVAQNELVAVGVFSIFEARMQELVGKRKFFQGLQELLIEESRHDLAHTIRMYYLAVNVLKHGAGSSHNELLSYDDLPFLYVERLAISSRRAMLQSQAG